MAIPGTTRGGLTTMEMKNAVAMVDGPNLGPLSNGPLPVRTYYPQNNWLDEGGRNQEKYVRVSSCQAGRTPPNLHVDLSWFGRALHRAAVAFGAVPPLFVHSK